MLVKHPNLRMFTLVLKKFEHFKAQVRVRVRVRDMCFFVNRKYKHFEIYAYSNVEQLSYLIVSSYSNGNIDVFVVVCIIDWYRIDFGNRAAVF